MHAHHNILNFWEMIYSPKFRMQALSLSSHTSHSPAAIVESEMKSIINCLATKPVNISIVILNFRLPRTFVYYGKDIWEIVDLPQPCAIPSF
jgi:hypothetical protein